MKLQNLKTKQWDQDGKMLSVRVSADDTIVSYEIESQGVLTTRHRKYIIKLPTQADAADGTDVSTVAGSTAAAHVSLRSKAARALKSSVTEKSCCHHGMWSGNRAKHL